MNETNEQVSAAEPAPARPTNEFRIPPWVNYFRTRLRELAVVFFGVYAAFLLNRFDVERNEAKRRGQILESLEREFSGKVDELRRDLADVRPQIAEFDRRLAAGEMPPLGISYMNSAYSPSDDATLLQAGGLELLDVKTLDLLRKVNGIERSILSATHNQFELSLVMLANHERADFYDPDTKKLKERYAWYPVNLHNLLNDGQEMLTSAEELLADIRAAKRASNARH